MIENIICKTIDICKIVEDALKELYVHYKIKFDKHNDQTFTMSLSSTPSEDDSIMKIYLDDGFSKYLETQYGKGDDYTEVDIYLKDGVEKRGDNSFYVLGWWNQNMMKFPILSQVAKHVLAMSISTVASESAFSTDGRVIDKYRSSLTPKTAEALICAQDWLLSTPADLQDMLINGLPVEAMVENLEKLDLGLGIKDRGNAYCGRSKCQHNFLAFYTLICHENLRVVYRVPVMAKKDAAEEAPTGTYLQHVHELQV
ncbi:zinc finger BED domain-containing protein RICESLEEPER 2-like protein [Tanacetum coccineum]